MSTVRGVKRAVLRLPVWLYRARMGWLLGGRFLLLTHTGRKTGLLRHTVVEVIRHDRQSDTYFVVAAWGERSDRLRNVRKTPRVQVTVGRRRLTCTATPLTPEETARELRAYMSRHRVAARVLVRLFALLGLPAERDPEALARTMVVVAIRPTAGADEGGAS